MNGNATSRAEANERYFSATLAAHGPTPQGVGWNGERSQFVRFEQLLRVIDGPEPFSINDLGCGYGALLDYLGERYARFAYRGYDVAGEMVHEARKRHGGAADARFTQAAEPTEAADYGVASGIFNIRFERSDAECQAHLLDTLDGLWRTSARGCAFNCLTRYSQPEKMRAELYYADPCVLFDACQRRYARRVVLLHDYELYDFTIIVRR